MTPAASNRARGSTGRDFAVRVPRGARRFQDVGGNRVGPDVWDDKVLSALSIKPPGVGPTAIAFVFDLKRNGASRLVFVRPLIFFTRQLALLR
jgi:hypothetical protein